ncbi:MAG: creatininase family protein [Synergistaceae bacterium]|jgi:creatinine amidohydrolase|nr:creatininase family protein [Synergistaceae bacterium]
MKLIEMNYADFEKEFKEPKTIIIPSGAFEVWGPHLPIGADTIVAEEIANRLADRMGWIVGPTLPVGDSVMVWGPGTVTARPESFKMYLEDICGSLIQHGTKRFCFINPHVGNVPIINQVAWDMKSTQGINSCVVDWWRFIQPLCSEAKILEHEGQMAHGHASEAGTSVFLYLRPDLVKTDRLTKVENKIKNNYLDIGQFYLFKECCDTYVIGDAVAASREKGEKIVTLALDRIVEFLKQWK